MLMKNSFWRAAGWGRRREERESQGVGVGEVEGAERGDGAKDFKIRQVCSEKQEPVQGKSENSNAGERRADSKRVLSPDPGLRSCGKRCKDFMILHDAQGEE